MSRLARSFPTPWPCLSRGLIGKTKRPTACSGDGPFLNLNNCCLGSGFISQRDVCRLTATLTHLLAQNSHGTKVNAGTEVSQGLPTYNSETQRASSTVIEPAGRLRIFSQKIAVS